MKRKTEVLPRPGGRDQEVALYQRIRNLIVSARQTVARGVDVVQVCTNFEIGRHIVEYEQQGKGRAAYGEQVLAALAGRLSREFGRGFSLSNLKSMRLFFLQNRSRISQFMTDQLDSPARDLPSPLPPASRVPAGKSSAAGKSQSLTGQLDSAQLRHPFKLSWTHYVFLQMQMYVNYYDRHVITEPENPTIGVVLCKKKNQALVEITLPKGANIHSREYQLYLPSKAQLRQKLLEWTGKDGR